ncbi:MAG: acyltransferase [Chthoniobacteraceae bacterium]|nr:acyltransferase [Chthoniobacteraceae bacterium]
MPAAPSRHSTAVENRAETPPQKLAGIQALRGIAALMVVGFHALIYHYAAVPNGSLPRWAFFGTAGVDLFFVISGFVMVYVTRARFGSPAHQANFLLDRAARIYPPYWIATLPVIAACLFFPGLTVIALNPRTLADSLLLLPSRADFPLLRVGWTLIHEMFFYVVFSFFLLGKRETLWKKLAAWAFATVALFLFLPQHWKALPALKLVSSFYSLEFIGGGLLALLPWPTGISRHGGVLLGGGVLLLGGVFALPGPWPVGNPLLPLLLGVPCCLIVAGAICLEDRFRFFHWNVLQRTGDASFQIYLWHNTVLSAAARAMLHTPLSPYARLPLAVALALGVSYLAHLYFEKPLLKVTRRWRITVR